jgi:hypothetical protein
MKGATGERWRELCSQAAEEQDPDRLMYLISEINRLLEEKEQRLQKQRAPGKAPGSQTTSSTG